MSFQKRMLYGTKELWNKILEEINGIKTWCDNRFVSKDSTPTTTYPIVDTGLIASTTTVQENKQSLTLSGPFTYYNRSNTTVIRLSPTLIIVFGTTKDLNPTNNSEYIEEIDLPDTTSFRIKNVLGVTLTQALSGSATNSNLVQGTVEFISLTNKSYDDNKMDLRFVFDIMETRTNRSTFRINYICFVEVYQD